MKRLICFLLALLMLFATAAAEKDLFSGVQTEETERVGHVVSVVFDDSSSMSGLSLNYARHAMHCFLAMLDPKTDVLYITFMSKPNDAVEIPLDKGIAYCTDLIDQRVGSSLTPFEAVRTAMNALQKHRGKPMDQYWLLVLTDGVFNNIDNKDVDTAISQFLSQNMSNDTLPNACYVAIGKSAQYISATERLKQFKAEDSRQINSAIQNVANMISGCIPADSRLTGSVIEVTTVLPANRIIVIDSGSGIVSASASVNGKSLNCNVTHYETTDTKGSDIAQTTFLQLQDQGSALPAGTYQIHCVGTPAAPAPTVIIEPALKLHLRASRKGDSEVEVTAVLSADGEDKAVDPARLPNNTTYRITAFNGKNEEITSSDSPEMKITVPLNQDINIEAQVILGGVGSVMTQQALFQLVSLKLASVAKGWEKKGDVLATYEIVYAGKDEDLVNVTYKPETDLPVETEVTGRTLTVKAGEDRAPFAYLGEHQLQIRVSDPVLPTVDSDTTAITVERNAVECARVSVKLIDAPGQWMKAGDVIAAYQINYDGPEEYLERVVFEPFSDVPVEQERIGNTLFVKAKEDRGLFTKLGEHPVQLKLKHDQILTSDSTADLVAVVMSWIELLILIGGGTLLLVIVIGEFSKRRFPKDSSISVVGVNLRDVNASYSLDKFTIGSLIPFVRESRSIGSCKVYAAGKNVVMLKRSSVPRASSLSPQMPSGGISEMNARPVFSGDPEEQKQKYLPLVAGETMFLTSDGQTGAQITLHVKS